MTPFDKNFFPKLEVGQEKYTMICAGAFRGSISYEYYYKHIDGELFYVICDTVEECRIERLRWIQQKNYFALTFNTVIKIENNVKLKKKELIDQIAKVDRNHPVAVSGNKKTRSELVNIFNEMFGVDIK